MHVFHTAGVPPKSGNSILPIIGSATNINPALRNSVSENSSTTRDLLESQNGPPENVRCGPAQRIHKTYFSSPQQNSSSNTLQIKSPRCLKAQLKGPSGFRLPPWIVPPAWM